MTGGELKKSSVRKVLQKFCIEGGHGRLVMF